jgi:hypothetical protein
MKTQPDLFTLGIRKLCYVYMNFGLQEDLLLSKELFVKNVQQCDNLKFSKRRKKIPLF